MIQDLGVQVTLLTVLPGDKPNASESLVQAADKVIGDLEEAFLAPYSALIPPTAVTE